jgi:hypothetical protein
MGVVESAPFQKRRDQVVRTAADKNQIRVNSDENKMTALIGENNNTRN